MGMLLCFLDLLFVGSLLSMDVESMGLLLHGMLYLWTWSLWASLLLHGMLYHLIIRIYGWISPRGAVLACRACVESMYRTLFCAVLACRACVESMGRTHF